MSVMFTLKVLWNVKVFSRASRVSALSLTYALLLLSTYQTAMAAKATFTWTPDRDFYDSRGAYHDRSHRYRNSYSHPEHYSGIFDGCKSDIILFDEVQYQWRVERSVRLTAIGAHSRWVKQWESEWTPACRMLASGKGEQVGKVFGPELILRRGSIDQAVNPNATRIGSWELADLPPVRDGVSPATRPRHSLLIGPVFERMGLYRVRLTIRDTATLQFADYEEEIPIKNIVVAVLGDSYAAGEGNPDRHGRVEPLAELGDLTIGGDARCEWTKGTAAYVDLKQLGEDYDPVHAESDSRRYGLSMATAPDWLDLSAHRSMRSGHALAAHEINDFVSSQYVWTSTFLTFAVSGAEARHIDQRPQSFFQYTRFQSDPGGSCSRCGQLHELVEAVGSTRVDALILSIGGNDLGFSDLLKKGITDKLRDEEVPIVTTGRLYPNDEEIFTDKLDALRISYRRLNINIRRELNVGTIYLTGYPVDLFSSMDGSTTDGCGIFDTTSVSVIGSGITQGEADLLRRWGGMMRDFQMEVASELGWVFIDVADAYVGHGYCTKSQSFFRSGEKSCEIQGDVRGAMHPNDRGHAVYRDRIFRALRKQFEADAKPRDILGDRGLTGKTAGAVEEAGIASGNQSASGKGERGPKSVPSVNTPPRKQPESRAVISFDCKIDGDNAGCRKRVFCPASKRISLIKAACNLEYGTVSSSALRQVRQNTMLIVRESDKVRKGVCRVGGTSISRGQASLSAELFKSSVGIHCKEHDKNGGDCHLRGEMTCVDGKW